MYNHKDFSLTTLASGITSGATSLTVATGEGSNLPTAPFKATIWNSSDYTNPNLDPNKEIILCTVRSGDSLSTIQRGMEGTAAVAHNTGGKIYSIFHTATAGDMADIKSGYYNGAPFWNPKFVNAYVSNAASGDQLLYTVPAGRKAIALSLAIGQATGSSINVIPKVQIGGTKYRAGSTTAASSGTSTQIRGLTIPGNAGDAFYLNSSASGCNVWLKVLEFDSISPVVFVELTSFVNGDNTFHTCPASVTETPLTALDLSGGTSTAVSVLFFAHDSGSSRTLKLNSVKSGGSLGATNLIIISQTASNAAVTGMQTTFCLEAGDFLSINTDSTDATQIAWMILHQLPIPS